MDRVFYVIPYTSIIDQNADEARKVLEDKDKNGNYLNRVVLEHHSNLTPDEETRRQNLLAENSVYYTCHCTSTAGYSRLKKSMGERIGYLSSGNTIFIG